MRHNVHVERIRLEVNVQLPRRSTHRRSLEPVWPTHHSAQGHCIQELISVPPQQTGGVRYQRRPLTHPSAVPLTCEKERIIDVDDLSIQRTTSMKPVGHRPPDRLDVTPQSPDARILQLSADIPDETRGFAGFQTGTTLTYVSATIEEIATALAALTGEPHPLAA
ncbi:hypothetical protein [Amycolatopsis sp. WGS_07]|uniref:hypothetical protein n=1 Tax=Amycolatopsis sp. WGS_07 TaxID=3076764 RepID=UPI003873824F